MKKFNIIILLQFVLIFNVVGQKIKIHNHSNKDSNSISTKYNLSNEIFNKEKQIEKYKIEEHRTSYLNIKGDGTFVTEADSLVLVALYNSTNGSLWTVNTNWLTGPVNSWVGITVSSGQVTSIEIIHNNLTGSIPAELGNLTNLEILYLYNNQISGPIPAELGNLSNLKELSFGGNLLSGPIPAELGNLSNLVDLSLGSNQLTGSIPAEIGNLQNLVRLYLNSNQLTGSIPAEIGNLTNLIVIYLYSNQISGNIPSELGNLLNLQTLQFHSNFITGSIPAELGNLSNLTNLFLDRNQLSGQIPSEIGNLSNLEILSLPYNKFSGSIPPELGNLLNLKSILLYSNQFSGSIPPEIRNLSNLNKLIISNNLFENLPSLIGTHISYLEIFQNKFTFEDFDNTGLDFINGFLCYYSYAYQDTLEITTQYIPASDGDEIRLNCQELTVENLSSINNEFALYKGVSLVYGWSSNPEFIIPSYSSNNEGVYTIKVRNSDYPTLTLFSKPLSIGVTTDFNNFNNKIQFLIYPNPSKENVTVEFNSNNYKVKIIDAVGNVVYENVSKTSKHLINLNNLASGLYFVLIEEGNNSSTKKLIVK